MLNQRHLEYLLCCVMFIIFTTAAFAVDEAIDVSLSLTGTLKSKIRDSGNYSMYIQNWTIESEFTQSSEYTLIREASGRIGGVPTFLYGAMESRNALFEPTVSPLDPVTYSLRGNLKVTGCVSLNDRLSSGSHTNVQLPPGLPPGISSQVNMGGVAQMANRGTFFFEGCRTDPEKVLIFYIPPEGLFGVPGAGPFPDCYEREATESGQYRPYLLKNQYKAAVQAECSGGSSVITEDMAFIGSVTWEDLKQQTSAHLQKHYFGSEGNMAEQETYEDHDLTLALDLNPGQIHAEPGGPYTLPRADTVTLDGTHSVPSKGHHITSWEWQLTPEGTPAGCNGIGSAATMTGNTVSFVALCSVKVKLTVKDDAGKTDSSGTEVVVSPRPWKTEFVPAKNPVYEHFSFTLPPVGFVFGYNRCTTHTKVQTIDTADDHWYEPKGGNINTSDYETGTFWLKQVTDQGPFAGVHYVSDKDFQIKRTIWLNNRLFKGTKGARDGDVYELNTGAVRQVNSCAFNNQAATMCSFGEAELARLREGVLVHENLHSTLAAEVVQTNDPANNIETKMDMNRTKLKNDINVILIGVVDQMKTASDEIHVINRMPSKFKPGGCIDFPDWDSAARGGCYYYFSSFADKGEKN